MKVHILESFPLEGDSRGTTKSVDEWTADELITAGYAVSAEDGGEHPEAKEDKAAESRKDKTDKAAHAIKTK